MNELYESHGVYIRTVFPSMRRAALIPRMLSLYALPEIQIRYNATTSRLCCSEGLRYIFDEVPQRTALVHTLSEARKACVHRRSTRCRRENGSHLMKRNAGVDGIACPGKFPQRLGPRCSRARSCVSTLLHCAVVLIHDVYI